MHNPGMQRIANKAGAFFRACQWECMKEYFEVTNGPASQQIIEPLIQAPGVLPSSCLSFLRESNGAEFGITDSNGDSRSISYGFVSSVATAY